MIVSLVLLWGRSVLGGWRRRGLLLLGLLLGLRGAVLVMRPVLVRGGSRLSWLLRQA
jgi:hypothetical protein